MCTRRIEKVSSSEKARLIPNVRLVSRTQKQKKMHNEVVSDHN